MEDLLDIVGWLFPLVVVVAMPIYERIALAFGREGRGGFVERDGRYLEKNLDQMLWGHVPIGTRIVRQIGRDLRSPISLLVISYFIVSIVIGVLTQNSGRVWFGIGLGCFYVYMFVAMMRHQGASTGEMFEATLVEMTAPKIAGIGMATLRTADGRTLKTGVRWRPLEAARRRGDEVIVVLVGSVESPMFAGFQTRPQAVG